MNVKKQLSRIKRRRASQPDDSIARVNGLISTARTNWLALLAYLSFIGITLLGVEDADFFFNERQTTLPLVGVNVPTVLFFYIAPTLGAMLYIHLHLYLMKLWRALGELPTSDTPIAERISPWIVAEMALGHRPGATFPYALKWLGRVVARLSIFAAGPFVLAAFWWWSMPKHDEALTMLACGVPLFFCSLMGFESWKAMRRGTEPPPRRKSVEIGIWSALALVLSILGWMRTAGITSLPHFLASAQLSETVFVQTPPDWLSRDEAEQVYRFVWCKDHAITALACGAGPLAQDDGGNLLPPSKLTQSHRDRWCDLTQGRDVADDACKAEFESLDVIYTSAWNRERQFAIAKLPKRNLRGTDLRGADLSDARLEGADLRDARLEGADLRYARLEGADLRLARLEGADLWGARLEGADLWGARLEGADLRYARLEGADLRYARLKGADLFGANLKDAFGDLNTQLPENVERPSHWPNKRLSYNDSLREYEKWRQRPSAYSPPGAN